MDTWNKQTLNVLERRKEVKEKKEKGMQSSYIWIMCGLAMIGMHYGGVGVCPNSAWLRGLSRVRMYMASEYASGGSIVRGRVICSCFCCATTSRA